MTVQIARTPAGLNYSSQSVARRLRAEHAGQRISILALSGGGAGGAFGAGALVGLTRSESRPPKDHKYNSTPREKYGEGIAKALERLGNRYLLAVPINASLSRELQQQRDESFRLPKSSLIGPTSSEARRTRLNGGPDPYPTPARPPGDRRTRPPDELPVGARVLHRAAPVAYDE